MSTKHRFNPKLFLRAAEMIETGKTGAACVAIACASSEQGGPYPCVEREFFAEMFKPRDDDISAFFGPPTDLNRHRRVVALCFAYAMTARKS